MMLTADYTKIENYEEVVYRTDDNGDTQLSHLTHALVMVSMAIGQGELTKKTLDTWYERIRMYEIVNGPFFVGGQTTREMLETHIGLKVNVAPTSNAKFKSQIFRVLRERVHTIDRLRNHEKSLAS
jgi:hypothetical protein